MIGRSIVGMVTEHIAEDRHSVKFAQARITLFIETAPHRKPQEQSRIDIVCGQPMNAAALPQWPDALGSKLGEDGKSLTVYSSRPARTLFEIMKWLDQQGMQLEDVHLKRPTLEDVFVELTGKKLRD